MTPLDYNHLFLAVLFTIAALAKYKVNQHEHFFTRLAAGTWYFATVEHREMPTEVVRLVSTYVIIIILVIEISSPIVRKIRNGK